MKDKTSNQYLEDFYELKSRIYEECGADIEYEEQPGNGCWLWIDCDANGGEGMYIGVKNIREAFDMLQGWWTLKDYVHCTKTMGTYRAVLRREI